MPQIRMITDLRNTTEISEFCHARHEPLFTFNRNGLPKVATSYESMFRGLVKKYSG